MYLATVSNKGSSVSLRMAYHFIGVHFNMSLDNGTEVV